MVGASGDSWWLRGFAKSVITSYSIHYTKLYDQIIAKSQERTKVPPADGTPADGTEASSQPVPKTEARQIRKASRGRKQKSTTQNFEVKESMKFVITSYSIHYTKLYDTGWCADGIQPA